MRTRAMLQFLKQELVWAHGDRLYLYRPEPGPPTRDPTSWPVGTAERGLIYADRPLRVKSLEHETFETFPNAEAILAAGWLVDQ